MSIYQVKRLMMVLAAIGTFMAIFTVVRAQEPEQTYEVTETCEEIQVCETEPVSDESFETVITESETECSEESETSETSETVETSESTSVYEYIDSLTAEEAGEYYRNFFEIRGITVEDLASYDDETFNAVMAEWDYAGMRAGLDANDLV